MKINYFLGRTKEQLRQEIDDCWRYYFKDTNPNGMMTLKYMKEIMQHLEFREICEIDNNETRKCG